LEEQNKRRRHVKTGGRKGAPVGNTHALKHGRTTAVALAHRKVLMALVREARAAVARV
jgi:hypothetical protein